MSQTISAEKGEGVCFSFWLEGDDRADYRLAAFKVEESLFSLTKIEVLLKITASSLGFADYLGKKASLTIQAEGLAKPAHFSGAVAEVSEFFEAGEVLTRLVLLPSLAALEKELRYRVFQELTIPDIVETLLCEHGIADALWQLEGNFTPRHFCMQYGETDLAFMHRILAEEGIFYYFIHEECGVHRPVLCNNISLLLDCPNGGLKHDSHDSHGLYDVAGAAEVYCHALRRSRRAAGGPSGAWAKYGQKGKAGGELSGRGSAVLFSPLNGQADGSALHGIAHLPLPLCGHKAALSCPFDKSLNGSWALIAVRHEGMGAESGLLAHDLADYFDENVPDMMRGLTEMAVSAGAYGRAFGPDSLLPRLMQVNGRPVYEEEFADSPYGMPYKSGAAHNVVSMAGKILGGKPAAPGGGRRKAFYACAFTALDTKAVYRPPVSLRPVIAGPQEARLICADKAARRYKLALRINENSEAAEEVRFWAYADTQLGAAVSAIAAAAGADSGTEADMAVKAEKFLIEFLGGNPDRPIAPAHNLLRLSKQRKAGQNKAQTGAKTGYEQSAFDDAELEAQLQSALAVLPRQEGGAAALHAPHMPVQPFLSGERRAGAPQSGQAGGFDFMHAASPAYNAFNGGAPAGFGQNAAADYAPGGGQGSAPANGRRHNAIPLAQIQAVLHSGAAVNAVNMPKAGFAAAFAAEPVEGSRFLQISEHQREDINGIYELNCGEKYVCRSKNLHLSASDKLILRGPGGKIIIDKYSMTLEAPLIRLRGRLAVEEDMFDRREGVKIAIRDELPLVADCGAGESEPYDKPKRH